LTAKMSWSSSNMGASWSGPTNWFEPKRIVVINLGGAASRPFAEAIHDELVRRGWVKEVVVIEPGEAGERADFFVCVGEPVVLNRSGGWRWQRTVEIRINGGTSPLRVQDYLLGLPVRRVEFHCRQEGVMTGYGMPTNVPGNLGELAEKVVTGFAKSLDQADCVYSPARPAFFTKQSSSVTIGAVEDSGAKLIWSGPGYLQNQRAFWLLVSGESRTATLTRFADRLKADGWKLEGPEYRYDPKTGESHPAELDHISAQRNREVIQIDAVGDWHRAQSVIQAGKGEEIYCIEYAERFSESQEEDAINRMFDTGEVKEPVEFERLMNHAQKVRLIALLEKSPTETGQWYYNMANRYFCVAEDAAKAEAALIGQDFDGFEPAVAALAQDFSPLDDMRASAAYRLLGAQNLLRKFAAEAKTGKPIRLFGEAAE